MQFIPSGQTPNASPLGQGVAVKQFVVTSVQLIPQNRLAVSSPWTGGNVGSGVGSGVGRLVGPPLRISSQGVSAMHF